MNGDPAGAGHLGRGWAFPVRWRRGPQAHGVEMAAGSEDVRQAILLLLRTGVDERVMQPGFGAGVDQFVFAPRSGDTMFELQQLVERVMLRWEPRVEVLGVEARPSPHHEARIDVLIEYRVESHRRPSSLVFPFYVQLAEAA
jgi:Bacteriophage baseplate protein W